MGYPHYCSTCVWYVVNVLKKKKKNNNGIIIDGERYKTIGITDDIALLGEYRGRTTESTLPNEQDSKT